MSDRNSSDGERARTELVVSVIIATYNARQLLTDSLASIAENPPSEAYEGLVVDDASADGTSEMVRARFPDVRLLRNEIKRHHAFSNNRAFEYARGEYLLLLNNDTIVLPQALDRMVEFLREHRAGFSRVRRPVVLTRYRTRQRSRTPGPRMAAPDQNRRIVVQLAMLLQSPSGATRIGSPSRNWLMVSRLSHSAAIAASFGSSPAQAVRCPSRLIA
jgi:glycosyltransferase involved in cell wall biosynthesis